VESFTALAMNKDGDWSVIKWPKKREELRLKRSAASASVKNPDAAFRPMTEKMLAAVHNIWPGRKRNPKP
jgi:hypothetical protein